MDTDPSPPWSPSLVPGLWGVVEAFESRHIRYALIGGLAVGYRGRFRLTQDLDFILQIPQLTLPGLLEDLESRGFTLDVETVIREWVQDHMTSIQYRGVIIDWLKPVVACYQHVIDHAIVEKWQDHTLRVASVEGLIVTKLLAFRSQDQADIETLLAAHPGELNLDFIRQEWATVGEPHDPQMVGFERMVQQFYTPPAE